MTSFFFTIITSNLNSGKALGVTGASIEAQTFKNIQWLVVDGNSKDDSLENLTKLQINSIAITSEVDTGIYNAWNKALKNIQGDWVIFLGAGDSFIDTNALTNVFNWINKNTSASDTICYGSVLRVKNTDDQDGELDDKKWIGINASWQLGRPIIPCHQGVFHKAELFNRHPFYDESYKIAADSEIVIQELMQGNGKSMGMIVTKMLSGGISDNKKYRAKLIFEIIRINWKLGIFFKRPLLQLALLTFSWLKYSVLRFYK